MSSLPLLPKTDPQEHFALHRGAVVSRGDFQSQVMALAAILPASDRVLNLCSDRYWFAVSLFAAIARGIMTVLPNSAAPEHLAAVAAEQPGLLLLGDQDTPPADHLPYFRVDTAAADATIAADLPRIPFDRQVACVYTSGSTGLPAPHYKIFGRLRQGILAGAQRIWAATGGPCSVVATVPIRHMYGLESSVLLPILGGGRMSTHIPFFPLDIAASLAEMPEPRLLVITPFHLRKLLEADIALPSVAAVLSATAPLPAELANDTEARLGCPVIEIYGSTETGQLATRQPCRETVWRNLGDITLHVRDGETWAHGSVYQTPQMLNDTIELLSPESFRLLDRKANIVNVAGKRSSLSFLNATLTALPGIEDGAFCVPERNGAQDVERLAAFVVAPTQNRENILAGLRAHIDPVFLPRPIVFVDTLPRDGNGKLLARTLEALIRQHIIDRETL